MQFFELHIYPVDESLALLHLRLWVTGFSLQADWARLGPVLAEVFLTQGLMNFELIPLRIRCCKSLPSVSNADIAKQSRLRRHYR